MLVLEIRAPEGERRIVHISGDRVTLGSGPECDVVLEDESVSRQHAEIARSPKGLLLRDLESYTGTYHNDRWIAEALLAQGDTIRIGRHTLVLLSGAPKRGAQPAPSEGGPAGGKRRPALLVAAGIAALSALVAVVLIARSGADRKKAPRSPMTAPPAGTAHKKTHPPVTPKVTSEAPPGAASLRRPIKFSDQVVPKPSPAKWLEGFAEKINPILLQRCASCHDGSLGTGFTLTARKEYAALNAPALVSSARGNKENPLLPQALSPPRHPPVSGLTQGELKELVQFLRKAPPDGSAAWKSLTGYRPALKLRTAGVPARRELLLRRAMLDLWGRPPTEAEVADLGKLNPRELIKQLLGAPQFRKLWGSPSKAVLSIAGKAEDRIAPESQLARFYQEQLAFPIEASRDPRKLAASLIVNLWDCVPSQEDLKLLENVIKKNPACLLPVAAFLLGEIPLLPKRDLWIERACSKFLGRLPAEEERRWISGLLSEPGGPRGVVLGLLSSGAKDTARDQRKRKKQGICFVILDCGTEPRTLTGTLPLPHALERIAAQGVTVLKAATTFGDPKRLVTQLSKFRPYGARSRMSFVGTFRPKTAGLSGAPPSGKKKLKGKASKSADLILALSPYPQALLPLFSRFGGCLALSEGELAVCREVRNRLGVPLSPYERALCRLLPGGTGPVDLRRLVVEVAKQEAIGALSQLVVFVLPKGPGGSRSTTSPLEDVEELVAQILGRQATKAVIYFSLPFRGIGPTEGCAILWGEDFRRSVVITRPVLVNQLLEILALLPGRPSGGADELARLLLR